MQNLPGLPLNQQTLLHSVSEAVTERVLSDVQNLRSGGGAGLSDLLDDAVLRGINQALSKVAQAHATEVLGAERSSRASSRAGYRSGLRNISIGGPLGVMKLALVKSRQGLLRPDFLKDARRFTAGIMELGVRLWSHGLSLRGIEAVSAEALKSPVGRSTVGAWVEATEQEVLAFLQRPIAGDVRYLMLDGMFVSKKRVTVRKEPVLAVIGITDDGRKYVLDIMPAASESNEAWSTVLQRLKGRGLDVSKLRMAISDGCAGIINALKAELPTVPRQRCTVHKTRNVLGAAAPAIKAEAARDATQIWNAPNKSEARQRQAAFVAKYAVEHPKLVAIIEDDFEATLTFYELDAPTWKSLRSTNIIERFNREMRRKFDDMGACRGDDAVTRTAGIVSMRLAKSWEGTVVHGFKAATRAKHAS